MQLVAGGSFSRCNQGCDSVSCTVAFGEPSSGVLIALGVTASLAGAFGAEPGETVAEVCCAAACSRAHALVDGDERSLAMSAGDTHVEP